MNNKSFSLLVIGILILNSLYFSWAMEKPLDNITQKASHERLLSPIQTVLQLIKNSDSNTKVRETVTANGMSALHLVSSFTEDLEAIQILLNTNIDINGKDNNGCTPLYHACAKGHMEVVKKLISAHADINYANTKGKNPLIISASKENLEIMQELIRAGALVNCAENNGHTPLMYASAVGNFTMVKELIKAGATLDNKNKDGRTALHSACATGEYPLLIRKLIQEGADINAIDNQGSTSLDIVYAFGHIETAKELIRNKQLKIHPINTNMINISNHAKINSLRQKNRVIILQLLEEAQKAALINMEEKL